MTLQNIFTFLLPIITLAIGIFIGQFIKWNFEKRKKRYEERKEFIKNARVYIESNWPVDRLEFHKSIMYPRLAPYLSSETIKYIKEPVNHIRIELGNNMKINVIGSKLLKELDELEKKWELL